jgi:cation:H+ antiporter
MMAWLWLALGLGLLTLGARVMVAGGASIALRLGITPLVVGLTVMAYGTSAPELLVSVDASMRGLGGLAVGNVVGSNVCNIAFILGLCALIKPLGVHRQVVRREVPVLIGVSILVPVLLWDRTLGRFDGALLLGLLIGYTVYLVRAAKDEGQTGEIPKTPVRSVWQSLALIVAGLSFLLMGANLMVDAAVGLARFWGWSELLIGLTIVAVGTSLPELALSLISTLQGETDVAIGNVVGSCTFNLLGILGATGLMGPISLPDLRLVDLITITAVPLGLWPLLHNDGRISRGEGVLLLLVYVGYTGWLIYAQAA